MEGNDESFLDVCESPKVHQPIRSRRPKLSRDSPFRSFKQSHKERK